MGLLAGAARLGAMPRSPAPRPKAGAGHARAAPARLNPSISPSPELTAIAPIRRACARADEDAARSGRRSIAYRSRRARIRSAISTRMALSARGSVGTRSDVPSSKGLVRFRSMGRAAARLEARFDRPASFRCVAYLKESIATSRAHRIEVCSRRIWPRAAEMVSGFGVLRMDREASVAHQARLDCSRCNWPDCLSISGSARRLRSGSRVASMGRRLVRLHPTRPA